MQLSLGVLDLLDIQYMLLYLNKGTNDQYEVGDFSGKYGSLSQKVEYRGQHQDNNLPLTGPNSIVGRCVLSIYGI